MRPTLLPPLERPGGDVVCTWCGGRHETREALTRHWAQSPACGRNRNAVSAMRPGARTFGEEDVMPGAFTLELVRRNTSD